MLTSEKNKLIRKFLISCTLMALGYHIDNALADSPAIIPNHITHNNVQQTAKSWGLASKDFKHYLWLMQHTASGHWYQSLDPAEVLGINAKNKQQMLHYAKIQARNMHVRVNRELMFDRLYSAAYRDLYPNEKPIMSTLHYRKN